MHVSVIRWILANINFVILCTLKFFVVKVTLKSLLPTAVFLVAVLHACRSQHALLKGLSKQRVWHSTCADAKVHPICPTSLMPSPHPAPARSGITKVKSKSLG